MANYMILTNTETAKNLAVSFAGECQARMRYEFYAEKATEEGFISIAHVFTQTAKEERGHAETFYDYLTAGLKPQSIEVKTDVGVAMGTTPQNLQIASGGEFAEASDLYPKFAIIAAKEGFPAIAESFEKIAGIEKRHSLRFKNLFERYKKGMLYKLPYDATWQCLNCGYLHKGKSAPEVCPSCRHPQSYFITVCNEITLI